MVDINNYEGLYMITQKGVVFSARKNRFLKLTKNNAGYLGVSLSKYGLSKSYSVHRLVAEMFLINPLNKEQVNHKDGNKINNDVNNLEWVTRSENSLHSINILGNPLPPTWKGKMGAEHNKSISIYKYDKHGNYVKSFGSISEASRLDGILISNIAYKLKVKTKGRGEFYYLYTPHFQI